MRGVDGSEQNAPAVVKEKRNANVRDDWEGAIDISETINMQKPLVNVDDEWGREQ
jgi:hypothetical protein